MGNRNSRKTLSTRTRSKLDKLHLSPTQYATAEKLLSSPMAYMADKRFRRPREMATIMAEDVWVGPGQTLTLHQEQILFLKTSD